MKIHNRGTIISGESGGYYMPGVRKEISVFFN